MTDEPTTTINKTMATITTTINLNHTEKENLTSTLKPEESTSKPEESTSKPEESTSKPEENSDQWIDDLKNFDIKNHDDAQKLTDIILNNTENNYAINNSKRMIEVMDLIEKLQVFVESDSMVDLPNARNYTNKTIGIFSNLIDQSHAWDNSTIEQKTQISSKILSSIQSTSFTLVSKQEKDNEVEKIIGDNIYLNTFITNSSQELLFPNDNHHINGSIEIPKGILLTGENTSVSNRAVGAVIDKLHEYLLGGITKEKKINSMILSFSLTNTTESVKINKQVTIR